MEQKINKIREKCIEANPSIRDLAFGCMIKQIGSNRIKPIIELHYTGDGNDVHYLTKHRKFWGHIGPHYDEKTGNIKAMFHDEWYEIIGRDIRLADVLVAIEKAMPCTETELMYNVRSGGEIYTEDRMTGETEEVAFWNLLKDRLEDQSEECIEFIHNLLSE